MGNLNTKPTRVIRFCSRAEAVALMNGETIYNDTNHSAEGRRTTSIGCCFAEGSPREAWRRLKGLGIYEVCLELVFKPGTLIKSKGRYTDYSSGEMGGSVWLREWCCTSYSLDDILSAHLLESGFASQEEIECSSAIFRMMEKHDKSWEKWIKEYLTQ